MSWLHDASRERYHGVKRGVALAGSFPPSKLVATLYTVLLKEYQPGVDSTTAGRVVPPLK